MKIYAVGGSVRDALLNIPVKDRDWVVVGSTPDEMRAAGYRPVGKDFPVFLHPESQEEYALARTERKVDKGYHGFQFHAAPEVTLEEDLARRDLTINAIAQAADGTYIDPFNGREDIANKVLRHVSPAFSEDPVRILRLARFAARFKPFGFTIAPETMSLMQEMVRAGEVDALVAERVWQETERALALEQPAVFFETLRACGALAILMPELEQLWGVPNPEKHHPEIDTGVHTMMVLEQAALLSPEPVVRFAALLHDLGKGLTPKEMWPKHHGHEGAGVRLVDAFCKRLRVPKPFHQLARLSCEYHGHAHRAKELKPQTMVKLLQQLDAYRKPARFEQFILSCIADSRGRTGFEHVDYEQADILRRAYELTKAVDAQPFVAAGLKGEAIKNAIFKERVRLLKTG